MASGDYFYSETPMELGARTANVATFIAFSKIFGAFVSGLTFIVVARLLGPSNYGVYTLALGVAGFFGAFGSLSVGPYYNKVIPAFMIRRRVNEVGRMIGNSMLVLLAISGAVTIIGTMLSGYIATYMFHNPGSGYAIMIAMFSVFLSALYTASYSALVSLGEGKRYAIAAISYNVFQSFFSLVLVYVGFGPAGAIGGLVIGLLAGLVVGLVAINSRTRIKISTSELGANARKMLGFSIPLTGAGIIGSLVSNFGIIFLGIFTVPEIVGAYGVASKIGSFVDIATGTIGLVLIPMFSAAVSKEEMKEKVSKIYNSSVYYGFLLAMPIIIYLTALSRPFALVFFTTNYTYVPLYMSLISVGILVSLLGNYAYSMLAGVGKVRRILLYSAITGFAEIISLLILVPFVHVLGLIIALSYIGGIIVNVLYIREMKNELQIALQNRFARVIAANVILLLVIVLLLFSHIRPMLQLISGILLLLFVYPIILGVVKAISKEEIRTLEIVSNNIPCFGAWLRAILSYASIFAGGGDGV